MGISRSTLERMRRRGEVEEIRQYNRVYILVTEPRTDTDSDLLEEAREELAESETSRMELGSEVQRLRDRLSVMSDRVESAENRESRARAEASWSEVEASWARVEKQNTDRQLIGEPQGPAASDLGARGRVHDRRHATDSSQHLIPVDRSRRVAAAAPCPVGF